MLREGSSLTMSGTWKVPGISTTHTQLRQGVNAPATKCKPLRGYVAAPQGLAPRSQRLQPLAGEAALALAPNLPSSSIFLL